ncbi:hypothetical protein BJ742DRAFT_797435 [Cladochytrium replicatum]|nr:hypothetical protein BJ742DRAFT_797435 [Cladochytrium replicatum]
MEALFESMRACVAAKSVVLQIHGVMTKQVAGLALVVLSEMGAGKLKKIKLRIRKPRDEHSWGMFVNALRTHAPTLEDVDIALRRCGENTSEFEDALDVLLKAASGKLRNLRWDVEDERPHYTLSSVQRSINDNAVHPWILQSLGLTHTFLYSTEDAQVLAEALLEMTRTLQHLSLLSSQITDEAMAILAPAISALDDLQTLDLGRNLISDAGCASLVSAWVFSCPSRLKLTHLQLGHNCIGEIGFKVLASKLPVVAPCLHTLNLSWNRSRNTALPIQASSLVGLLCPSALTDLVPPLDTVWSDLLTPPNLPRLQTLKIVNTEFLTQRGLADLAQALHLRSTNMPLRELDLSFSFRRVRPGPNTEGSTGLLCLFLQLLARSPTTCCELNYLGIGCNRNRDANPGNSPPSSPSPEHLREWRALVRVLPMLKSTHGLGLSGWSVSNWRVRVAESVEEGVCIPERVVEILDDLSCGDDDGVCIVS